MTHKQHPLERVFSDLAPEVGEHFRSFVCATRNNRFNQIVCNRFLTKNHLGNLHWKLFAEGAGTLREYMAGDWMDPLSVTG